MTTIEELREKVRKLSDELEDFKKKPWPQDGDTLFFLHSEGACKLKWSDTRNNRWARDRGLMFKTYEECEHHDKYLKALTKYKRLVKEYNGDWVADFSPNGFTKKKWGLYVEDTLKYSYATTGKSLPKEMYFKDDIFLQWLLEEMPEKEIILAITGE